MVYTLRAGLRAGMPQAVIAEIGAGRRIVGLVALCAIGRRIAAAVGHYGDGRALVIVVVVGIVGGIVVIAAAVIGVGAEPADRSTRRDAGPEAATAMAPAAAATIPVA